MSSYQSQFNESIGIFDSLQLTTTPTINYVITSADDDGSCQWTDPATFGVTSAQGTASQILINGLTSAQVGACVFTLPSSINPTTMPNLITIGSTGQALSIAGASISSAIWNNYVSLMDQKINVGANVSFGNIGGTLTTAAQAGITSLGTLTGLIMGGNIAMGNNSITNGNTATFTSFVGALTGAASLNLLKSGGTMSGNIAMGNYNISGVNVVTAAILSATTSASLWYLSMYGNINCNSNNVANVTTLSAISGEFTNLQVLFGKTYILGSTISATQWAYLANLDQNVATTSSPTFGTVTASLTGHASLDLALTGGTLSGSIAMGGFNISGGGTFTATTFSGSLTGHSSLDLALTGGTMSGNIAMGTFNISNAGTITATTLAGTLSTAAQANITSLGTLSGLTLGGNATSTGYLAIANNIIVSGSLGNTSPTIDANNDRALQVMGTSSTKGSQITCGSGTLQRFISLWSGRTGDTNPVILYSDALRFGSCTSPDTTGYAETMRIMSGNLLIGTATNASVRKLLVNGSIEGTNIYGTLGTAAQANITSVGTLTSLTVGGNVSVNSAYTIQTNGTANSGSIVPHQFFANSGTNRFGFGLLNTTNDFGIFGYDTGTSAYTGFMQINRTTGSLNVQVIQPLKLDSYTNNTNGNITAGSYTPTIANAANVTVAGSTALPHFYTRIGDRVHIDGYCLIQSNNAANTAFGFTITIPTGANFSGFDDAVGAGPCYDILSATKQSSCTVCSTNATQTLSITVITFATAPGTAANEIYVGYSVTYRVR